MNSHRCVLAFAVIASFAAVALQGAEPGFWDSRPLKIIQTTDAIFPRQLAAQGLMEGEVRAVINVDSDGKLADCLITAYTRPEFAREVLTALRSWKYEPAHDRGEPVGIRGEIGFFFEAKGSVLSVNVDDLIASRWNQIIGNSLITLVCTARELDQPLRTVEVVKPRHPGKLVQPSQPGGTARIDFYVDDEGRVRMPVVLRASHPWYAHAAMEALSQWKFAPPTRGGRPVAVRVMQDFVFGEDS